MPPSVSTRRNIQGGGLDLPPQSMDSGHYTAATAAVPPPLSPSTLHHQSPYFLRSAGHPASSHTGENPSSSHQETGGGSTGTSRNKAAAASRRMIGSGSSGATLGFTTSSEESSIQKLGTTTSGASVGGGGGKPVSTISNTSTTSQASANNSGRMPRRSSTSGGAPPASAATTTSGGGGGGGVKLRTPRTSTSSSSTVESSATASARQVASSTRSKTSPVNGGGASMMTSCPRTTRRTTRPMSAYKVGAPSSPTKTTATATATAAAINVAASSPMPVPDDGDVEMRDIRPSAPALRSRKRRSGQLEPDVTTTTTTPEVSTPTPPSSGGNTTAVMTVVSTPPLGDGTNLPDGFRMNKDSSDGLDLGARRVATTAAREAGKGENAIEQQRSRVSAGGDDLLGLKSAQQDAAQVIKKKASNVSLVGSPNSTLGFRNKRSKQDYGDRFIPQRDGSDLAATYKLVSDGIELGVDGLGAASAEAIKRAELEKHRRKHNVGGEIDTLKDEANRAYSELLKNELFGSASPGGGAGSLASSSASHAAGGGYNAGPVYHNHHPAGTSGSGVTALPPLPAHVSSAPSSSSLGVFATGGSQGVARGSARTSVRSPGGGGATSTSPSTPMKKKMFSYASPSQSRPSSPSSRTMAASPGSFGIGLNGTGIGTSFDDMLSEKYSLSPIGKDSQKLLVSPRRPTRWISKTPFKVLDAPDLQDDFYLNLVSWSQSNKLAVGLSSAIYLWNGNNQKVTQLCDLKSDAPQGQGDIVTGLEWTNRGSTIAVGTNKGKVEIWDAERIKRIRTMDGHTGRVGTLAWNESLLTTGSRDRTIMHRDVRMASPNIRTLKGHGQEVCGLKWNLDTNQLASGGNDNKLFLWEKTNDLPLYRFSEHCAAVKAISWSPHQRGLLASGGGTADKKIRYWNGLTGTMLSEWDTGSQVCNLMWSKNSNEIISTHGYSGGNISNQICIWRYPTMAPVATLIGHSFRVLFLAMSPDGQTIVTGSGDETLRFWNTFQQPRSITGGGGGGLDSPGRIGAHVDRSSINAASMIR